MKGLVKWVLYVFAAYNIIVGIIAVTMPSLLENLYAISTLGPETIMTGRWLGALAIAIGYGAFTIVRTPNKEIVHVLIISAIVTMFASILGVLNGNAAVNNIAFDFVLQLALVIVLFVSASENGLSS